MNVLEEKLRVARSALESARGYAIWSRAPCRLTDAISESLVYVEKASQIAAQCNRPLTTNLCKEKFEMKELTQLLKAFGALKSNANATTERLLNVGEACDKMNARLDEFFEAAGIAESEFIGDGEAAPNAELDALFESLGMNEAAPNGEITESEAAENPQQETEATV